MDLCCVVFAVAVVRCKRLVLILCVSLFLRERESLDDPCRLPAWRRFKESPTLGADIGVLVLSVIMQFMRFGLSNSGHRFIVLDVFLVFSFVIFGKLSPTVSEELQERLALSPGVVRLPAVPATAEIGVDGRPLSRRARPGGRTPVGVGGG